VYRPGVGFNVAADAYDAFMGRYSTPLSPQLADLAGVRPGDRALDVGAGTGALTRELVTRLGAERVAAADPSPAMVSTLRARFPGLDVRQASAEALPFVEGTFDATGAQLVVHFMSDPVTGLREMGRVTRRGGVVAASVWDHGGGKGPLGLFWDMARRLDAAVADESHLPGVHEGELEALFREAGLQDVRGTALTVRLEHATFEEWWDPFTQGVGPAGAYVSTLDAAAREGLRGACRAAQPRGPFAVTAVAWAATGRA
jgi:SAM-dependent methyltransferase